jgi:hypothetical protein
MTTALNVNVALPSTVSEPANDLWEHSRNNLGIARLLVHERRPAHLVATACHMAVETACRVACQHTGARWTGDVQKAFEALAAPEPLRADETGLEPAARLSLTERRVTWLASVLRHQGPGRGFRV